MKRESITVCLIISLIISSFAPGVMAAEATEEAQFQETREERIVEFIDNQLKVVPEMKDFIYGLLPGVGIIMLGASVIGTAPSVEEIEDYSFTEVVQSTEDYNKELLEDLELTKYEIEEFINTNN